MNEQIPKRDFRSLVETLREQWRVVAGTVGLVLLTVLLLDLFVRTPLYRSDTEVLVRNSASDLVAGQVQPDADRSMSNEQSLAESRSVTETVEAIYGDEIRISVQIADNRDVLVISSVESSPELAQEIASFYTATYLEVRAKATLDDLLSAGDVIGERLVDLDQRITALGSPTPDTRSQRDLDLLLTQRVLLSERLDQLALTSDLTSSGTGRVISSANLPDEPVSPNTVRDGILALAAGLIIGMGLAYLRALLRDEGEEREQHVKALENVPVFVELPLVESDPGLSVIYRPTAIFSEAIRSLRTTVRFAIPKHRAIQVASAKPNDGKTTVTANLAYALAADGHRVVMVDADLRTRGLSEIMGFGDEEEGLASVLERADEKIVLPCWHDPEANVWLLPAGRTSHGPAELLGRSNFERVIEGLRTEFDVLLIDSPPLLPVTDGSLIASVVDDVLLTVGRRSTPDEVARARKTLSIIDITPTGTIVNGRSDSRVRYGYGYGADPTADDSIIPGPEVIRERYEPALLSLEPKRVVEATSGVPTPTDVHQSNGSSGKAIAGPRAGTAKGSGTADSAKNKVGKGNRSGARGSSRGKQLPPPARRKSR